MPQITKELALKIAKKLKADIRKGTGKKHDVAEVWEDGTLVALFTLRRGSRKDQGHDFISGSLFVRPSQAKDLARCPMSREEWLDLLREKERL